MESISDIAGVLFSQVGAILATILGFIALFFAGKRSGAKDNELKRLKADQERREKINEVEPSTTRDAAVDRLRDNDAIR